MISYFVLLLILEGIISDPLCKKGENNCSLCNPKTKLCIECDYDVYSPDEDGGCKKAKKCDNGYNYCKECNEDKNSCEECEDGYFPDKNGGCSYSNNCDVSYKGICLKCKESYVLNKETNVCKSLSLEEFRNCEKIQDTNGKCEKCDEEYFLTSDDKTCTKTENCKESVFGKCVSCNKGFYLDKKEQKCKEQKGSFLYCKETLDGKKCGTCDKNYFFDENGNCTNTKYCEERDSSGACKECVSGYYFSNSGKVCTKTKNCYSGIKSEGLCEKCVTGFYIDYKDGKCKSNQEDDDFKNCVKADGNCIECTLSTYLGDDYKCTDIIYCAESVDGICIECRENYYLGLDNKCSKFKHCIYSTVFDCLECEDNYYFEKNKKKCQKWDDDFYGCKYGYEDKGCNRCKNDFYLNKTDLLCYNNSLNDSFYKCAMTDDNGLECKSCIENYELGLKYHRCTNIKGCVYQDKDKCIECSSSYCLDVKTGLCESNSKKATEQYYKCKKTNKKGSACAECLEGWTLDEDGFCVVKK